MHANLPKLSVVKKHFLCLILVLLLSAAGFVGCKSTQKIPLIQKTEDESLLGTIWTRVPLNGNSNLDQEEWQFIEDDVLLIVKNGRQNNSWDRNGSSVTISINDNYATYKFQIINPYLMKGTGRNVRGIEWPAELRKTQIPQAYPGASP